MTQVALPSDAVRTRRKKIELENCSTYDRQGAPWVDDSQLCTLNALCNVITQWTDVQKAIAEDATARDCIDHLRRFLRGSNISLPELSHALKQSGEIRMQRVQSDIVSIELLPLLTQPLKVEMLIFDVELASGIGHTQTIDICDGYFSDPAYVHGTIKTSFFDDDGGIKQGWYKKTADSLPDGDLPDEVQAVWSVTWLPTRRKKKRKRSGT